MMVVVVELCRLVEEGESELVDANITESADRTDLLFSETKQREGIMNLYIT